MFGEDSKTKSEGKDTTEGREDRRGECKVTLLDTKRTYRDLETDLARETDLQ